MNSNSSFEEILDDIPKPRGEEKEKGSASMVYTRPLFWMGFLSQSSGYIAQICCVPFADMTLLAANAVFAILFNQILAIFFLKEKYVARYDLSSLVLLTLGTVLIIQSSNTEEKVLDIDTIFSYLFTFRTVIVAALVISFWIAASHTRGWLISSLDSFYMLA